MRFTVSLCLVAVSSFFALVACGGTTSRTNGSGTATPQAATGSATSSGSSTDTSTDTSTVTAPTVEAAVTLQNGSQSFQIFQYEAVVVDGKAHSVAGVIPTNAIDFEEAKAACEANGWRLCTQSEWQQACKGPDNMLFAYAATKDGPPKVEEACDVARTTNNTPGSLPSKTGSHPQCVTKGVQIWDMVGNASEWAYDTQNQPIALGVAFYQEAANSNCEGALDTGPTEKSTDMGFRCCK